MVRRIRRRLWQRLPSRVWRILKSRRVDVKDKLMFVVPVGLYWVMPDLMPMLPIDDAAVTALAGAWFAWAMERKYGPDGI